MGKMATFADRITCIGTEAESLCGETDKKFRFMDADHAMNSMLSGSGFIMCPLCYTLHINEMLDEEYADH